MKIQKHYYLIYKITNNLNQKFYIGKHETNNLDDDYFGSGKHLINAQNKYGLENFTKTILFYCHNQEEMNLLEHCVVTPEFCARKDVYNIMEGGDGGWNYINNQIQKGYPTEKVLNIANQYKLYGLQYLYDNNLYSGTRQKLHSLLSRHNIKIETIDQFKCRRKFNVKDLQKIAKCYNKYGFNYVKTKFDFKKLNISDYEERDLIDILKRNNISVIMRNDRKHSIVNDMYLDYEKLGYFGIVLKYKWNFGHFDLLRKFLRHNLISQIDRSVLIDQFCQTRYTKEFILKVYVDYNNMKNNLWKFRLKYKFSGVIANLKRLLKRKGYKT